jgi:hypothetical protein
VTASDIYRAESEKPLAYAAEFGNLMVHTAESGNLLPMRKSPGKPLAPALYNFRIVYIPTRMRQFARNDEENCPRHTHAKILFG